MELITIKSGPLEVLVSGSVISFKNNPIEIKLGPENDYFSVILKFETVDDKTKTKVDGKVLDNKTIEMTFKAMAESFNGNWTTEPISLGFFNFRPLYLNVHFYIYGKDNTQVSLRYTFYLGDRITSPPSPGGEINK